MATWKDVDTGSDQITQLCNFCDSNVSDGFCGDCEDHMCQSCFDIHTKAKACRHHVLLDSTCQKGDKNTYSESCKLHPSMIIKFYCVAHKIAGCVECFFPEHRNCNYQNIETAAKLFQDSGEDTRIKREIQRLENTHSEYTRRYEDDKETVAVINNTVVKDVKSFTDSVTSYVAQAEKNMLEKSESLHIENETRLERRSNDLDSVGNEIEKCKMQLENEDRVDRLFISAIEIGPVIEQLGKNITSIGRQHAITKYEFQPNKLIMEMTDGSGSFGEIRILQEAESKQQDVSNDSDGLEVLNGSQEVEASGYLESIPPPIKDMVESMSISPEETLNEYKEETKNCSEKENGNVAAKMPLKNPPIAEKKGTFYLKSRKEGKFYLIKSDACSKPFRYTPQSKELSIDEDDDMLYDGDRCFTILVTDGVITLDEIVDAAKTNSAPVKATSSQNQSLSTYTNESGGSCVGAGGASANADDTFGSEDRCKHGDYLAYELSDALDKLIVRDQEVEPGNEAHQTEEKIFPITGAESNRSLTIYVRASLSKQSGKETCYMFGCKTMDVYLRWKMAMRETSIFKRVVKKLPIAKKYQLNIASQNAALLIEAPSGPTCTEAEALRVLSDVVNGIVEDTKVYSCECIQLYGDDAVKVLTGIRQSRLSSDGQLVEAYDETEDKLWVLCHPKVKDRVMNFIEKARKVSQMKPVRVTETLKLTYIFHQRLNVEQFKYDFEQSFPSVEMKHEKIPEENIVIVSLRSETAEDLKAAKMWICNLEDNLSSLCSNYSDHGGHVSADLMTEFLNMSFENKDIKHETNEEVNKVWIWSSYLDQTDLDKHTNKARNIIKNDKVFKSVSLPIANIDLKNAIEKLRKKYDKFVRINCKENEVVISGLCYLVDMIQRELDIETRSSKTGQNKPGSAQETNFKKKVCR